METERSLLLLKGSSSHRENIPRQPGVSTSGAAGGDPGPAGRPPRRRGQFTAALPLKLKREEEEIKNEKKKHLPEINVAGQRLFTTALRSMYIGDTIKPAAGENREPHVR